jgi:two-component system nitrogen regulation response regulator GlnG
VASAHAAAATALVTDFDEPFVTPMPEPFNTSLAAKPIVLNGNANGLASNGWEADLELEAQALLATGCSDVWDVLSRRFESKLIQTALLNTRGRRIEAAQKLGIGRNTITRKIQELNLE